VWQPGNEIRATAGKAPEGTEINQDARAVFFCGPPYAIGHSSDVSVGGGGKGQRRPLPLLKKLRNMTITIFVIEGPSKGLAYEMKEPCITLGRTGGGADFQFNEPEASEIQCVVATRQNGVCLYDAVSIHGTYVDDQRIAAAELTHMSTFRIGSSRLLVKVHPNQSADAC